jgi:hypothetical protein
LKTCGGSEFSPKSLKKPLRWKFDEGRLKFSQVGLSKKFAAGLNFSIAELIKSIAAISNQTADQPRAAMIRSTIRRRRIGVTKPRFNFSSDLGTS